MKDAHPDKVIQVWFQDEARFGQQGTTTRMWALKGSRPSAVKQCKYKWLYLFDAVCPVTGNSVAMIVPFVSVEAMDVHLKWISESVGPEVHIVLVLDRAGWHVSGKLVVPANITLHHLHHLHHLPPYSPELNPVENKWGYRRSHSLSNRCFTDHDHMHAAATEALNAITPERNRSICATPLAHARELNGIRISLQSRRLKHWPGRQCPRPRSRQSTDTFACLSPALARQGRFSARLIPVAAHFA